MNKFLLLIPPVALMVMLAGRSSMSDGPGPDIKASPVRGPASVLQPASHLLESARIRSRPVKISMAIHLEGYRTASSHSNHKTIITEVMNIAKSYGFFPTLEPETWFINHVHSTSSSYLSDFNSLGVPVSWNADFYGHESSTRSIVLAAETSLGQLADMGIAPRHISGQCTSRDWVAIVQELGLSAVTGTIAYCLKSMALADWPVEFSSDPTMSGCTTPADCHIGLPTELLDRSQPWFASSGSDWWSHSDSGLLILPTGENFVCAYENLDGESHTGCTWTASDQAAIFRQLDAIIADTSNEKPKMYMLTWSLGTRLTSSQLTRFFSALKKQYIDTGKAEWKTVPELIDVYTP